MLPLLLTLTRKEGVETFDFTAKERVLKKNDFALVQAGILAALYADEGFLSVTYRFIQSSDTYEISRDFEKNTLTLSLNGGVLSESQNEVMHLVQTALGSEAEARAEILNGVYGSDFLSSPDKHILKEAAFSGLTQTVIADQRADFLKRAEGRTYTVTFLEDAGCDTADAEKTLLEKTQTAAEVKHDLSEMIETVAALDAVTAQRTALLEKEARLSSLLATKNDIAEKESILRQSDSAQEGVPQTTTVLFQTDILRQRAAAGEKDQSALAKDLEDGKQALTEKETAFFAAQERVTALYARLDAYTASLQEKDAPASEGRDAALAATHSEILAEIRALDKEIGLAEQALAEIHLGADKKMSIREGFALEILLDEKQDSIAFLQQAIEADKESIAALNVEKKHNTDVLEKCQREFYEMTGEGVTVQILTDKLNEHEQAKQFLYRSQIVVAGLFDDVKAVDDKIYENQDALRVYQEDLEALENAKRTLIEYDKKSQEKMQRLEEKLVAIRAKQLYLDEIDGLEYGMSCPLCNATVTDKGNILKDYDTLSYNRERIERDITRTAALLAEYGEKAEKINLRLGELTSKITLCRGYISSLKETKTAKLSACAALLSECGVKDTDTLKSRIREEARIVAKYATLVGTCKNVAVLEEKAKDSIAFAEAEIERIETTHIAAKQEKVEETEALIAAIKEEYQRFAPALGGRPASSFGEEVNGLESREDDYIKTLVVSGKKRSELFSRLITLPVMGKDAHSDIASECAELLADIRQAETERQAAQDEYLALSRLVDKKQAALNELSERLSLILADIEEQDRALADSEKQTPSANTLSPAQKAEYQEIISAYYKEVSDLNAAVPALRAAVEAGAELLNDEPALRAAEKELLRLSKQADEEQRDAEEAFIRISDRKELRDTAALQAQALRGLSDKLSSLLDGKAAESLSSSASQILSSLSSGKLGLTATNKGVSLFSTVKNKEMAPDEGERLLLDIAFLGALRLDSDTLGLPIDDVLVPIHTETLSKEKLGGLINHCPKGVNLLLIEK